MITLFDLSKRQNIFLSGSVRVRKAGLGIGLGVGIVLKMSQLPSFTDVVLICCASDKIGRYS